MLTLAHHRGLLSGRHYAQRLLHPGNATPRPSNPYWCPLRNLCWRLGFSMGAFQVLYRS
jgi:hypothetical protein